MQGLQFVVRPAAPAYQVDLSAVAATTLSVPLVLLAYPADVGPACFSLAPQNGSLTPLNLAMEEAVRGATAMHGDLLHIVLWKLQGTGRRLVAQRAVIANMLDGPNCVAHMGLTMEVSGAHLRQLPCVLACEASIYVRRCEHCM
jgi:hypothetical protein